MYLSGARSAAGGSGGSSPRANTVRGIVTGVTVRAPAKVKLQLAVGPRRADGYHGLVTVFQAISLYDDVTVTEGAPAGEDRVLVTGEGADAVPASRDNLALAAATALARAAGLS